MQNCEDGFDGAEGGGLGCLIKGVAHTLHFRFLCKQNSCA